MCLKATKLEDTGLEETFKWYSYKKGLLLKDMAIGKY